jgi:serine/threonine protein kinase
MDYVANDMKGLLLDVDLKQFHQKHVEIIAYNMLCAINYLHSSNLMHRDIKPANMLINSQSQITLCDFGQSRTNTYSPAKTGEEETKAGSKSSKSSRKDLVKKRRLSNHITSRWYRSPEVILTQE